MARRDVKGPLTDETLNDLNYMLKELYDNIDDATGKITDDVFQKIIDNVKMNRLERVETFDDLPDDAELGDTIMVTEQIEGKNRTYRFDGHDWVVVEEFDATAITELDDRLTKEINKKETVEGSQSKADNAEKKSKEYTDLLENKVFNSDSDVVKVVESGSNASGHYVRYSNGEQRCSGMSIGQATDTASGSIFTSDGSRVEFPIPFDDSYPIDVSVNVSSRGKWGNAFTPNATGVTVYQLGTVKATATFLTRVSAVGRWK